NVRTLSPVMDAKYFRPHYHGRNVIALHFTSAFATGWGGRVLPPYNRWFLGGEQDLRGFDVRSVAPIAYVPVSTSSTFSYTDPTRLDIDGNPQSTTFTIPTLAYQ